MYPQAYIEYLVYFHGLRDYFECHEVLEEHWKSEGMKDPIWVALIQIAVSSYHHRRGNFVGARRTLSSSLEKLQQGSVEHLGIDQEKLVYLLTQKLEQIESQKPYESINLPIIDKKLLLICKQTCEEKNCSWGIASDPYNEHLIHKHKLRDRSDVIAERQTQLQIRKQ